MGLYPENVNVAQDYQTDGVITVDKVVTKRFAVTPVLGAAAAYVDGAASGTAAGTLSGTDLDGTGDIPRNAVAVSDNNSDDGTVAVTGLNYAGGTVTENLVLNGTTSVVGNKAMVVTQVVIPANQDGSISVGTGAKIGLPDKLAGTHQNIVTLMDGTVTTGTYALNSTAIENNTVAIGTAFNGTKQLECWYRDVTG